MSAEWRFQIRLRLADEAAEAARRNRSAPELAALHEILARHDAELVCLYDAFANYVAEAEKNGTAGYPLHAWTKATIEDPVKKKKHLRSFTVHVRGAEVYPKAVADALEADLRPLAGGPLITSMNRHDTNPANNPRIPKRYRSRSDPKGA